MTTVVPADLTLWGNSGGTLVPPNESAIQVQCPNCGGYRISRGRLAQPLDPPLQRPVGVGWVVLAWIFFLITIFGIYGLVLISAQARALLFHGKERITQRLTGYDCTCQLCGLRFKWLFADPHPAVAAKADLVRQGAEKLRQEEEERRRRMDD